jgi:hypothetical protein
MKEFIENLKSKMTEVKIEIGPAIEFYDFRHLSYTISEVSN